MLIDRLHYALGLDTSELKRGWASADNLLGSMDARMRSLATGAGIASLALALGKIGVQATKMAMELGGAMNEVWSITDKTAGEMKELTGEILNLSRNIPESAPALAKAYYQVLSAGITDASKALDVLSISSRAATAGLTTTFTTVDAITNVLNAYSLEAAEAQEISDDFFIAVRDGKMTMEQLAPAIGQVVGTAALAKVEIKEVLSAMVAMTLAGYSVDESATSMNRLLLSIVNTQEQAKEAAKAVGIEWSVAGLQAKGFQGFIKEVNEKAGDNIELLQAMVPEIRAFRAAAVIAGTGADNYARSLDNLRNSAGATDQAMAKIMSGIGKQWQLQKNRLNAAMIELGQRILPGVKDAVKFLADGFETLGLTGETEARRLQREWQFVGQAITSVGDIAARATAMQKALSMLLAPGQDTLKVFEEVKDFFTAFPVMSERAKQIQELRTVSAGELVEALTSELDYLNKITEATNAAQLQDKQRLVSARELAGYQEQILALQRQARAVGDEASYIKLAEISEKLTASQQQWTQAKRESLLLDSKNVVNQITMTQAAAAAEESQKELKVSLADTSQRLLVSENRLAELEDIRISLGKKMAEAAKQSAEARAKELKAMKEMERVQKSGFYQRMLQSTIQTTDRGGGLPYGAFAMPKSTELKLFSNKLDQLWKTFFYGENAVENLTSSAQELTNALFMNDQAMQQATIGVINLFEGIYTTNPVGIISGVISIFSSFNDTTIDTTENVKRFTRAMEEFDEDLKEMTFKQLTDLYQAMWTTLVDKYGNFTRRAKGQYTDEQRAELDEALENFGKWGDDFAGMIKRWNYEIENLGIEDPIEKMQRLARYVKQYMGVDLPADVEDGLDRIRIFIESLGAGTNIQEAWKAAFGTAFPGQMTPDEMFELIELYRESLQEVKEWREETAAEATKTTEETVAFTRTKQITYRQAEEMTLSLWSIYDITSNIYTLLNARLTGEGTVVQWPAGEGGSLAIPQWPILSDIYNLLDARLTGTPAGYQPPVQEEKTTPEWPVLNDILSRLNLYVSNCYVSTQNALVDVIKAQVYISGTTFVPDTYGGLIYKESDRVLRSKGEPWPV